MQGFRRWAWAMVGAMDMGMAQAERTISSRRGCFMSTSSVGTVG